MQSKTKMITGAAVLSLLLLGVAPAIAEPNTPATTTTTATEANLGSSASLIIQMAQAAHDYAQNLLAIAQQHSVDVSQAQALIGQGDQLVAQAQGELSSNPGQAAKDALQAMRDYRDAARSIQSKLVESIRDSYQTTELQNAIQRVQGKLNEIQAIVTKVCSASSAPQDVCSDAQGKLGQAATDLQQASTMVTSDPSGAAKLVMSVVQLVKEVHADLEKLVDSTKTQRAIDYIQNVLEKRLAEVQQKVQNANLDPTLAAQVQAQLTQVQSLLTSALQDFKAGNFSTGAHEAQQAMQLLQQVVTEVMQNTPHP